MSLCTCAPYCKAIRSFISIKHKRDLSYGWKHMWPFWRKFYVSPALKFFLLFPCQPIMGLESGAGNDVVDLTDSDDAWEKIEEATNAVTKELDDGVVAVTVEELRRFSRTKLLSEEPKCCTRGPRGQPTTEG